MEVSQGSCPALSSPRNSVTLAAAFWVVSLEYNLEPQITREELQRRKLSNEKTYTTAEVLAYLETL